MQIVRIQDCCHHQVKWEWMNLSQIELVWVRVRMQWEWFEWIWEKKKRCLNPRWQCLNPPWQNSRWLPSSSWVRMNEWILLVQNGWIQDSRVQDGCLYQVKTEWMSLSQIELVWFRVLCKMVESKMAEFKMEDFKMVAIIKLIRLN